MGLFFADFIGTLLPTLLLVFLFKQFLSYRNAILGRQWRAPRGRSFPVDDGDMTL